MISSLQRKRDYCPQVPKLALSCIYMARLNSDSGSALSAAMLSGTILVWKLLKLLIFLSARVRVALVEAKQRRKQALEKGTTPALLEFEPDSTCAQFVKHTSLLRPHLSAPSFPQFVDWRRGRDFLLW